MSVNIHYFFEILDCFPKNLRDLNEKQEERCHQDFENYGERYQDGMTIWWRAISVTCCMIVLLLSIDKNHTNFEFV